VKTIGLNHREFRRVRYWLTIAGTLVFALLARGAGVRADFSSANFKRIWAEEFGQGLAGDAKPPAAFQSVPFSPQQPHPAVARIVVPEGEATSFGSGTLVDVRDGYGIVVTNWHVVRDAQAPIDVIFPDGFTSKARALKVDSDWDLAALVIYQPHVPPVKIAATAPQPGDQLTICGYGPGIYRSVTGRCTQYYSPKENLPQQMVELNVEARQGDSGGPILNSQGELAGVLFGAGDGTTMGSFGGRVDEFLASLAPDIGVPNTSTQTTATLASAQTSAPRETPTTTAPADSDTWQSTVPQTLENQTLENQTLENQTLDKKPTHLASATLLDAPSLDESKQAGAEVLTSTSKSIEGTPENRVAVAHDEPPMFEKIKSGLAALGLFAIVVMFLKAAG
jgi:hypothetical protein